MGPLGAQFYRDIVLPHYNNNKFSRNVECITISTGLTLKKEARSPEMPVILPIYGVSN
jgi:hypothetical protein